MQFRGGLLGRIKGCLRPMAEDLVLVGDNFMLYGSLQINQSKELLNYVSNNWKRVFVVPGPVEIMGNGLNPVYKNMDEFQDFISQAPQRNIYMLNNSEFHDGDKMLVGSTFWCGSFTGTKIINKHCKVTIKMLDDWAKEDAEFIGRAIKTAANQNKQLTIATYFSAHALSPAVCAIMYSHLKDITTTDGLGKWVTGLELQ